MGLFESKINITGDGVYRPINPWTVAIGCAVIFSLLGRQLYLERIPLYAAFLFAVFVILILIFTRNKYGKLGIPYVKISLNELAMFLPGDSRGKVRFDLENLCEIQIYGRSVRRKYRFLRRDGTFVELIPYFGERAEQAVIQFLVTNLPPQIGVKICEPQTFFEEVRGDGP
jgi:hypothetical protein